MIQNNRLHLPKPFMVAVDDVGWMNGGSLSETGGPWRIGFERKMKVRDYHPFVEIGKAVGVRFQTLFVLAEMDRLNILKNYPTATQEGKKRDNSDNIAPMQFEIMNYVKNNANHIEFGLHGVGHEHWENGKRTRAEWYDMENDKPWPEEDLHAHVKAYKEILSQYGLSEENGHSFPESFVPCAWAYYWNPNGEYSTGKVVQKYGVKFINTWFEMIPELNPPIEFGGGFDHGTLVVNRYNYGNDWYMAGTTPTKPLKEFKSFVIESHWSNWLATDYFLQKEVNKKWIEFLTGIQKSKTHYLAKNSEQFFSQWLYMKFAKTITGADNKLIIDNSNMPDEAYEFDLLNTLVLRIKLEKGTHISEANIDGISPASYYEDEGWGFLYFPRPEKKKYEVNYRIGKNYPKEYIYHSGTYNVYSFLHQGNKIIIEIKVYGTDILEIVADRPKRVISSNKNLQVVSKSYDDSKRLLKLTLRAHDIQGEKGIIKLIF